MSSQPPRFAWITRERCLLAAVLLAALAIRGGVLWALRGNLSADPDAYRQIAENLLRHGVFAMGQSEHPQPTAYRPPLYPVVLSNLPAAAGRHVSLAKVAVLHVLLGVGTVWLTWLIARRVGSAHQIPTGMVGTAHPTAASLLVACDPILLHQQSLVMTETLATLLAALALWCLVRFSDCRSWFWAGLSGGAIGLAALCRPTFLPWLGLVGVAMLVVRGGRDFRFQISDFRMQQRSFWLDMGWRLANFVALSVVAIGIMSPWAMRNYRVFGKPIATTTHGGYTLYLGNNPEFFDYLRHHDPLPWTPSVDFPGAMFPPTATAYPAAAEMELWMDQLLQKQAWSTMRNDPRSALQAGSYRIRQLWSPLPHKLTAEESTARMMLRYATCAWYCGVYALAAVGIWRLRGRLLAPPWIWGVLLCLAFTAVHTFYWTNLRMRAPLMPFVALVAAGALMPRASGAARRRPTLSAAALRTRGRP